MREAAFFDLDKTVIAKASMAAFGLPMYREGLISRRTILRAVYAQFIYMHLGASEEKLARIRDSALALAKGWDRDQVSAVVADTLERVVDPIVFAEALELIADHRANGRTVVIVSASPEEIVVPLSRYLGFDEVIATRAKVDESGRYNGEMEFYAYGPFKAAAIRAMAARDGIDLENSYAYSDSYTDVPMLEAVGHPVAVNPDRVLLKLAREREWEVRNFTRPVRLRGKVNVPSTPATVAIGVASLVVGAIVVAWKTGLRPRKKTTLA